MRSILTVAAFAVILAGTALAQTADVYEIGNGVRAPRLVKEVKPNYTAEAKSKRVQGVVELSAVVLADGTVGKDIKVTRSLDPDLDVEAVKALKQWLFEPGTRTTRPVAVRVSSSCPSP